MQAVSQQVVILSLPLLKFKLKGYWNTMANAICMPQTVSKGVCATLVSPMRLAQLYALLILVQVHKSPGAAVHAHAI